MGYRQDVATLLESIASPFGDPVTFVPSSLDADTVVRITVFDVNKERHVRFFGLPNGLTPMAAVIIRAWFEPIVRIRPSHLASMRASG